MAFDRNVYFDLVRDALFRGALSQQQVDGQNAILEAWETDYDAWDIRWLAYALATTYHETSQEMWPIEEYGHGGNASYAKPDPETGQAYYGRGYVQLTWRENYARADKELGLTKSTGMEWHAENALDSDLAALVMFLGMEQGWFRTGKDGTPETFQKYFNDTRNDPYTAREIINGDKAMVPSWSPGVSIGNLIKGYHGNFLGALQAAWVAEPPKPPESSADLVVPITIAPPPGVRVEVTIKEPGNGTS